MLVSHIRDALDQVHRLQAFVLERNPFKGYSGKARLAPGLSFTNPWPLALAFGGGEVASGLVLIADHRRGEGADAEGAP